MLNLFANGDFRNFWFESGTPNVSPKLMHRDKVYRLDKFKVDELMLGNYDLETCN